MSNAVCQPYMSKPGQSFSEKPCEPHFGFQDQQSFSLRVDLAEADKYGFGSQKDMDMSISETIFVQFMVHIHICPARCICPEQYLFT